MKDRILDYLNDFANGVSDPLADELKKELKLDDPTFRQNCTELQSEILHHYDQFSISTIDAFFQRVIRSFTRESGLIGDYRLEVDQEAVLEEVINNLIDELGDKPALTRWVVEFAKENLENDRAWDVRASLMEFAKEIFREEFKVIEEQVRLDTANPDFFPHVRDELWKVKNAFLVSVSKPAAEILEIIGSKGWVDADFKYKGSGLNGFLHQFASNKTLSSFDNPGVRVRNEFIFSKNWPSKTALEATTIMQVAEEKFIPGLTKILSHFDNDYQKALSAEVALRNMYVFGLLSDIARKLQDYKTENNVMLLADAPKFLNGIIQDSDTPFIYERIGTFYRNYLIDEFQDTSGFQWKNFFPLLTNGMDQGYPSLVVGDVKQAIYRWRGGDMSLLEEKVESLIGKDRVEVKALDSNFRSAKNIIDFNNRFFKTAAALVERETGSDLSTSAYRDVNQKITKTSEGFVRINFLPDEEDLKWKDLALANIPTQLEILQQQGVALRDIAILVRQNSEGQRVAAHLLQYKNSNKALPDCLYDVVSNESLRMDGAASVNLLLGAMRYLLNPDDPVARAQLSFEFAKLHEPSRKEVEVFAVSNLVFFESQLPMAFTKEKISLKKLPLFELTESLIEIFKLGKEMGELAYLQAFQNLVLEFYSRERNDMASFLDWWEDNKHKDKASIKISGDVNAVKIFTIHKAKGLQFRYVIVPFCSWPLDHTSNQAPHLWVTTEQPPFSQAGYLPVNYSSTLERTYFQRDYQEERTRTRLDNLNVLYVALTRAEEGMIITAPHPGIRNAKGTVAQWLYESIQQNDDLRNGWNESTQEFGLGQLGLQNQAPKEEMADVVQLRSYLSTRWRDKLVIRQAGGSFFEEIRSDQRNKIDYGIHMHAVLSRIHHANEIPRALEQLVQEGLIVEREKLNIQKEIDELLADPVVGRWFSTEWEVQTEVSILLPGGAESRIDRLLTKDEKAIVIDFKTGEKLRADQKQVLEYMQILQKMNFKEVEGYLLYTRYKDVISLSDGKVKTMKKKDESQLGLF